MKERKIFLLYIGCFVAIYYLPVEKLPFRNPFFEALAMARWYAREHFLLCLVPAFFIAGAVSVFVSRASVIKYFGAKAHKAVSYGVAAVSGMLLAVCSCTVLPLFSGIYKRGAGLGPAVAFLYSGPAINILALILTARVLGWELGLARAVGAVLFSIILGLLMHLVFSAEEKQKPDDEMAVLGEESSRTLGQNALYFASMAGFLVFANWARPAADSRAAWIFIHSAKWYISVFFLFLTGFILLRWFRKEELASWVSATWGFAKQIVPLLLMGVIAAGLLLGMPGEEGFIPSGMVERAVGGNAFSANLFASVIGAFMYFATLTEIPILEGLIGAGMGKGPALTLLLAGPALSLPNLVVIQGVMGTKKTAVFAGLVIVMAALSGVIFGKIAS